MTPETEARLAAMEKKIDAIYDSVEKARQYALTTTVITIVVIVLPVIGLFFAVPSFLANYSNLDAQMELLQGL